MGGNRGKENGREERDLTYLPEWRSVGRIAG